MHKNRSRALTWLAILPNSREKIPLFPSLYHFENHVYQAFRLDVEAFLTCRSGRLHYGKTKPSWYLIATDDKMIPPPAQRFMSKRAGSTVVEVAGSHAIYVSQPNAVAGLIEKAAREVKAMATSA